jgi:hypothetical protein
MPLAEVTGDIGVVAMFLAGAIVAVAIVAFPNWRQASIARSRAREKESEARIADAKVKEAGNACKSVTRPDEGVHFV